MHLTPWRLAALLAIPLLAAACEAQKSSSPLSPSVAGPIPGVSITAPRMVEPANGADILKDQQPITLTVENAASTGVRPLSYLFEVAGDPDFNGKVFSQGGIVPGDGRTSVRLPSALDPDRTYYWRARAEDGANTGPFAATMTFKVRTPVAFEPPVLVSPVGGVRIATLPPTFVFQNARRNGPPGLTGYVLQVSRNDSFTALVVEAAFPEGSGTTTFAPGNTLEFDKLLYWRVRAFDDNNNGPWSATQTFRTPVDPSGGGGGGDGGGGGGGFPGSCASTDGEYIAACISAKYPDRIVPTGSLSQRQANMAFLRDRMIEAAICGGLDAGWNLKRCTPELSIDYLTVIRGGKVWGVDIGHDYDNYGRTLTLQWLEHDDAYACPKAYAPRPSCS
jgi:hypothetical protein